MQEPQESDDQALSVFIEDLQSGKLSYDDAKRRYQALGNAIQKQYARQMTALSLDVVHSADVKTGASRLEAQLTFDAYHIWAEEALAAQGCGSYTWAGDGLLAVFDRPAAAVAVGRALVQGVHGFNARSNRMDFPLQIRVGIHTGPVLPAESPGLGKVASDTFDLAGHLQKAAAPNQMLISETTYAFLRDGASQFVRLQRELLRMGEQAYYAFPSNSAGVYSDVTRSPSTGDGAQPDVNRTTALGTAAPAATGTVMPWVLGIAGLSVAVGVLVAALMLWPKPPAAAPGGTPPSQPLVLKASPGPALVDAPGSTPLPAANTPPANTPAAPVAVAAASAAPAGGPSRALWRSPDAESGVPPRLVASAPEQRWLLAIGVGRFRNTGLQAEEMGAAARSVADALAAAAQVPAAHVRVLADEEATLANIRLAFQWLQSNTSGKDTVFVYLGGPAIMAADRSDTPHPGGSGFALAPHDGDPRTPTETYLYGADVAAWLGATRAQTVIVLADAPHAGALDLPAGVDPGRQYAVLASASASQRAGSATPGQQPPFADALIDGLRGQADANHDHRVSLEELRQYLATETPRRSGGDQTPEVHAAFGGYLPELYFSAGG
jgi:class 3 adenylate cyclase